MLLNATSTCHAGYPLRRAIRRAMTNGQFAAYHRNRSTRLHDATRLALVVLPTIDPIATCYAGCRGICDCPTYRHR